MLIMGILSFLFLGIIMYIYYLNIVDVKKVCTMKQKGEKVPNFVQEVKLLFDRQFPIFVLFFPIIGVLIFSVLPYLYDTDCFTNYGGKIVKRN